MPFLIMTVGKTHSGKTTFGKKLSLKIKNNCLIDSDEIAEFLKGHYPNLYNKDFINDSNSLASGYYLKRELLKTIFSSALSLSLPIISTSSNSTKEIRGEIVKLAKLKKYKIIMIYFNLPEQVLLNRIKNSKRSEQCLYHSKDFTDLLINKQAARFEAPSEDESDYFFEIKTVAGSDKVFSEIIKIIK